MKIVIWLVCAFVVSAIVVGLRYAGVLLGAIPMVLLYAGAFALAAFLCKLWDNHLDKKFIAEQKKEREELEKQGK